MKTNVVMKSADRNLFGTIIKQETKTGFLNLTDLQEAYEEAAKTYGWVHKNIPQILSGRINTERIYYILLKQGLVDYSFEEFIELVEGRTLVKVLKDLKVYKTSGARHTKTTWCNPYIWVLLAMEMNAKLYAEVVMWLTDNLIVNRIEAGNFYKELSSELYTKFQADGSLFKKVAIALNFCIFNRHETSIRDSATTQQLRDLEALEKKVAYTIKMGYVKTPEQLLEDLRRVWKEQWGPKAQLELQQ